MISAPGKVISHSPALAMTGYPSSAAPVIHPNVVVSTQESQKLRTKPKKSAFKGIQLPKAPDFKQYQDKISTEFKKFSESNQLNTEKLKQQSFVAAKQGEKVVKSLFSLAMLYPNLTAFGTNINILHITALFGGIYAAYQWHKSKSEHHWKEIQQAAGTAEQSTARVVNLASDVILQTQVVEQIQAKLRDRLSKPKYISTMGSDGSVTYTFIDSKPLFLVSDANAEKGFMEASKQLADSKQALSLATRQLNTDYSSFRSTMANYGKDRWWNRGQKKQSNKMVNVLSACVWDDSVLKNMSVENLTALQNILIASIDKESKRYQGPYSRKIKAQFKLLQQQVTPQPTTPPPTFFIPPAPPPKPTAPEKKADDKKPDEKKKES